MALLVCAATAAARIVRLSALAVFKSTINSSSVGYQCRRGTFDAPCPILCYQLEPRDDHWQDPPPPRPRPGTRGLAASRPQDRPVPRVLRPHAHRAYPTPAGGARDGRPAGRDGDGRRSRGQGRGPAGLHRGVAGRGARGAGLRRPGGHQPLAHGGGSDTLAQAGLLRQGPGRRGARQAQRTAPAGDRDGPRAGRRRALHPRGRVLRHRAAERALPRARRPGLGMSGLPDGRGPDDPAPRVSVAISTWNRAHLVGRAIRSALAQTFEDFELLVVDDGSTDATPEVLAGVNDGRLRRVRHERNHGISRTRNTSLGLARGEWLAFLDDDNEWAPDYLERQLAFAASRPGAD